MRDLCSQEAFRSIFHITEDQRNVQRDLEYAVRVMVHTFADLPRSMDVQEFLDRSVIDILSSPTAAPALDTVSWVVSALHRLLGPDALIPPEERAQGIAARFSLRALEGIAVGIARNRAAIHALPDPDEFIGARIAAFWQQPAVADMSAAGLRGTIRIQRSIPFGCTWFNPMPDVEPYFDAIDDARIQRVRELSEIKYTFSAATRSDPLAVGSKAVVVLTYANWGGFYNECVEIYLDFLLADGVTVADAGWLLLTGALSADFNSLRDRNHSIDARREFVANLKDRVTCGFEKFDRAVVMSRSNLDFCTLAGNLVLLDFDSAQLQRSRIRLDKELVGWRHGVAHGNPPDLSVVDVAAHVDFPAELMLTVSDLFQEALLKRA